MYPFPNFNGCTIEVWEWIRINIDICIFQDIVVSLNDWGINSSPPSATYMGQWIR